MTGFDPASAAAAAAAANPYIAQTRGPGRSGAAAATNKPPKPVKAVNEAAIPVSTPTRSDAQTASLAAEQRARFTRRAGLARSMLSDPGTIGARTAGRMLGSSVGT